MSGTSWQFRTTRGVVGIEDDAIVRHSTPSLFLAGQLARWRNGGLRARATVALQVVGFLLSVLGLLYYVYLVAETGPGWSSALYVSSVGVLAYSLWRKHGRETAIQRSAIEQVTLDEGEREITITHGTADGPLSVLRDEEAETTLTLATDDDLRKAREICRLRGIDLEPPVDPGKTETTFRVFTREGACFCERCRSQVSPADATCPACEYALRVETSEVA